MAVPQRRISKTRKRMRRTHFKLSVEGLVTCPNCGERIDDDMILTTYDENVLSGYNILCNREDCGTQMAHVEFKLE